MRDKKNIYTVGMEIDTLENKKDYNYFFKILLLGETGVGKTSLMVRYIDSQFNTDYISTIGVNWMGKEVTTKWGEVKLLLWDVAGQSKHASYRNLYYEGAQYIIFVFDITNKESFRKLRMWIDDTLSFFHNDIQFTIIGNKIDLEDQRAVEMSDYNELFTQYTSNISFFFETSAKTGENVNKSFYKITEILVKESNLAEQRQLIPESS